MLQGRHNVLWLLYVNWISCHIGTNFMKKSRGAVKNSDIFLLIIIWYFTKWMMKSGKCM